MDWVKEKMHQARLNRIQIQKQEQFGSPVHQFHNKKKSRINRPAQAYNSSQKLVLLATGLVSGAIVVIVLSSANLIDLGGGAETDRLQSRVSVQAQQSVELQEEYINKESKAEVRGDEIQTNTVSGFEMLPPPGAGKAKPGDLTDAVTHISGTATSSDLNTISMQPTVDVRIQPQETNRDSGTWAINLVSLRQKVDAELFVAKVNSNGVAAEMNQVTVRGKKYWRVQVPGFTSPDEARKNASELQNRLGLKDVWIVQR
jgi:cell division septation protein DedD